MTVSRLGASTVGRSAGSAGSVPPPPGRARGRGRGRVVAVVVALILAAVVWLSATSPKGAHGVPLDPASTAPDGAKALALLLGSLGAHVDTSGRLPAVGRGVVLLLHDQLGPAERSAVQEWVSAGGALVLADPSSELLPSSIAVAAPRPTPGGSVPAASSPVTLTPNCDAPWVSGVSALAASFDEGFAPRSRGESASALVDCFPYGKGVFAVGVDDGRGRVVALAGPEQWTNQALARDDNSVLAANLLVSSPGATVSWLGVAATRADLVGSGHASLWSLVPSRVKEMLAGLLVAAIVLGAWRARRLGRPLTEAPVVPLPGSSLVAAVGRLLARDRQVGHAGQVLRQGLARDLAAALGLPPDTPSTVLASVAAARRGLDEASVLAILDGSDGVDSQMDSEADLVDLSRQVYRIREQLTPPGDRSPANRPTVGARP